MHLVDNAQNVFADIIDNPASWSEKQAILEDFVCLESRDFDLAIQMIRTYVASNRRKEYETAYAVAKEAFLDSREFSCALGKFSKFNENTVTNRVSGFIDRLEKQCCFRKPYSTQCAISRDVRGVFDPLGYFNCIEEIVEACQGLIKSVAKVQDCRNLVEQRQFREALQLAASGRQSEFVAFMDKSLEDL